MTYKKITGDLEMFKREELKKVLKEKKIKDLNDFMKEISKEVLETIFDEEITDFLGYKEMHSTSDTKLIKVCKLEG
ncbi:MAG: hypothetical protein DRH15_12200, partial [Deltaproteobacteria bacterium]